ncbi:MAG: hypothetical protein ABI488_08140 [Polyangiaceae bacterium]
MNQRGWWRFSQWGAGALVAGALVPSCGGRAQSSAEPGATAGARAGGLGGAGGADAGGQASTASVSTDTQLCAAALNVGQAPNSCALSCGATTECCGGGGYCDPTGRWTYYAPACFASPTTTTCTAPAPTSTVSGMTPLGPLTLQYAWAAEVTGFSYSMQLFFTPSATARVCDPTSLGFLIHPVIDRPTLSYVGQQDAVALLAVNGAYAYGAASIRISSKDLGNTHGTLTVTGAGWDLSGDFSVPDCPALHSFDNGK